MVQGTTNQAIRGGQTSSLLGNAAKDNTNYNQQSKMSRKEQIQEAAIKYVEQGFPDIFIAGFLYGAMWADSHPRWYDAQGDNVPEYGREVIVIGRDGKVFYGHRPDPKEVTMVEGKPYHAKTYDKNGWNWPNIALWLDVEVPDELIEQITDKWFEENEQKRTNSQ